MKEKFNLKLTEEMVAEVRAIGAEVDVRVYVIEHMFEAHKNDVDSSIVTSIPFKAYQKELMEYKLKYDAAVKTLGDKIIPMVQEHLGVEDVNFDWNIEDFTNLEVAITVK